MERRAFERVESEAKGKFEINNKSGVVAEFTGYLDDISENGLRIKVADDDHNKVVANIEMCDNITFAVNENYFVVNKISTKKLSGKVEIVRSIIDGGNLFLGCKICQLEGDIDKYISDKKLATFLKKLKKDQ